MAQSFQKPTMTKRDNAITAFTKIATAPLHALTPAMVDSIARSHGVAPDLLHARLAERQEREGKRHG
jgi:hypothetical protein